MQLMIAVDEKNSNACFDKTGPRIGADRIKADL